jgi:GNAT superfamily N-acetyltransferase
VKEPASKLRYPREREADIALHDGATVHVRPVRADDRETVRAFLEGLSPDSIGFRFFGYPNIERATEWSLDVDYADRFGLVAVTGDPPVVVAHAMYARMSEHVAEIALVVADAWQDRGISTVLLAHLAEVADRHGISTFCAEVPATQPSDDWGCFGRAASRWICGRRRTDRDRTADLFDGRGRTTFSGARSNRGDRRGPYLPCAWACPHLCRSATR